MHAHRDRNRDRDDDSDACSVCDGPTCHCAAAPDRKPPLKIKLTLSSNPQPKPSPSRPAGSHKDHRKDMRAGGASGGRPSTSQPRASSSASAYKPQKSKTSAGTKKKAAHGQFVLDPHARLQKPRGRPPAAARVQPITQYPANHKPTYAAPNTKTSSTTSNTKNGAGRHHKSATASAGRKAYRDPYALDTDTNDDASDAYYPTFVSAVSSTEDDDDDDNDPQDAMQQDAGNASDESSELTDPDDFSVQAEEERFIIAEEKARVRRELMGDGGSSPTARKKFDWQLIPRKGSTAGSSAGAGAVDETDSDSDSSEDEQADEDEEPEDDAEPDGHGRGRTASVALSADRYWSSSEDDFDAAVFFASLDSDAENGCAGGARSDGGDSTSTASELGMQTLQQQAGLVVASASSEHLPIVTQDMHGLLVFGDAKDPTLDMAFDIPSVPPTAQQSPNPHADDSTESDGDDAMDVDDDAGNETDDDGELGLESDGETTDDMCDEELMVRAPTPPSAGVNPLSTLHTPATVPESNDKRSRKQQLKDAALARLQQSPKPADILQRKRAASIARSMSSNGATSPSIASSSRIVKMPSMGRFDTPSSLKVVIIDGTTKDIPSPFARRLRRERVNRVRFPKLRRQQSPSPLLSGGEVSEDSLYSYLHAGPSTSHQFIELHDVLDTAILEDDEEEQPEPEPSSQHLVSASESDAPGSANDARSLSRWDRIPMNTFRKTRADVSMPVMNMTMSLPVGIGAGYGLKSSSAWWEADARKRERTASMLALSPILFGVDHQQHASSQLKIHRDKERRKRKSKTVDSANVKPLKRPSHAQRASSLVNVPPLHL
ncbi:hypothetical protein AURDEDRAFT_113266 [Auricularia subglabra TFB-10046 SS5]|nr:hypothetical protein AURDEDRAFT_113266 [Auricularia subglabra TFB-10046 SS5]